MIKISTKTEYGIILMMYLAQNKIRFVSLSEIHKKIHLPLRYLAQIASKLRKKGLIKAKEGFRGGYKLKKEASNITLAEIFEILEGPVRLVPCQQKTCSIKKCLIKNFWFNLEKKLKNKFKKIRLSQLIK